MAVSTSGGTSGGGYPALPIASAGGTTAQIPNPLTDGADTVTALVLDADPTTELALAVMNVGDVSPSLLIEPGTTPGFYFNDPTQPFLTNYGAIGLTELGMSIASSGTISFLNSGSINILGAVLIAGLTVDSSFQSDADLNFGNAAIGPVLVDTTNGHTYRLTSVNGALVLALVT